MRRALVLVLCLLAPTGAAQLTSANAAPPAEAGTSGRVLEQPMNGEAAIRALGNRLPEVAAANQTTAAELRERLARDDALWVDVRGRLFYVDPAPEGAEASEQSPLATSPGADVTTFKLHSLAGADRTVYLDFDGAGVGYVDPIGGAWDRGYTGGDGTAEPYNTEGLAGTDGVADFSPTELAEIRSIWQRVAEDFAPFAIDVTTEPPPAEAVDRSSASDLRFGTRVVLTSSATTCGCGGVAYVGVFDQDGSGTSGHAYYQPAFVYSKGAKAAAEAATHEAGHNLGLSHDGTRTTGYYRGHGDWAPIMGVGYDKPITQWSRGEYSGASNREDDFVVARANGGELRSDDVATTGTLSTTAPTDGVIGSRTDTDVFTLNVAAAAVFSFAVEPSAVSPNLDVKATLSGDTGDIATDDPLSGPGPDADRAVGLGARLSAQLAPGTYRLTVDGVGARDPLSTGYSDYGSLGHYRITVGASDVPVNPPPDPDPESPPAAPTSVTATGRTGGADVAWTAATTGGGTATGFLVRRETIKRGAISGTTTFTVPASPTAYSDTVGAGTYRYSVSARNPSGQSAWVTATPDVVVTSTKIRR